MQEMLASLGPQIEEATQDVSKMMEIIEQVSLTWEEKGHGVYELLVCMERLLRMVVP